MKCFPFGNGLALAFAFTTALAAAPVPSAERLLPPDTLLVITIPDWTKATAAGQKQPLAQLWRDPAMKPFVENLETKFKEKVITPLERELGIKFEHYTSLLSGQVTFALLPAGDAAKSIASVLLINTGDRSKELTKVLAEARRKFADSGKPAPRETIRDVELFQVAIEGDVIAKALGLPVVPPADGKPGTPTRLLVGQSDSLLLIGTHATAMERVLARQIGGGQSTLAEFPAYEANHAALFRDSQMHAWVNPSLLLGQFLKAPAEAEAEPANPLGVAPAKLIEALGLTGLKSAAFHIHSSPEGTSANAFIGAPQSQRKGIFQILAVQPKSATPPPFVGSDIVKFSRVRLDGPGLLTAVERLVSDLSPQLAGLVQLMLETAGKDKDPNFDLRKQLFGNLGDDFITLEKAPRSAELADLQSPPSLALIGSPQAEQLLAALRSAMGMINPAPPTEREFLGRKIYSITLPIPAAVAGGKPSFHFAVHGGYLALSSDAAMLEDYLRGADAQRKPLAQAGGLAEAAQKVGGFNTGWFGYDNQAETVRFMFDLLKKDPEAVGKLLTPPVPTPGAPLPSPQVIKEWFDVSLLPPFSAIAKYFSFTVQAVSSAPEGIHFKSFSPTPPGLPR